MLLGAKNLDPAVIRVLVATSSRVQACSARGAAPTRGATGWVHGELSSWFARSLDKDLPTDWHLGSFEADLRPAMRDKIRRPAQVRTKLRLCEGCSETQLLH